MTVIILVGGFVGFLLGLRFKVFVLVPTIGVALMLIAFVGFGRGAGWMAVAMILSALSIQLGYFCGIIAASLFASARSAAARSARTKSIEPIRGVVRR